RQADLARGDGRPQADVVSRQRGSPRMLLPDSPDAAPARRTARRVRRSGRALGRIDPAARGRGWQPDQRRDEASTDAAKFSRQYKISPDRGRAAVGGRCTMRADDQFAAVDAAVTKAVNEFIGKVDKLSSRWEAVAPGYVVEVALKGIEQGAI